MDPVRNRAAFAFLRACARLWLLVLFAALRTHAAESAAALEYRVKAAFLLNFAKFVDWPQDESSPSQAQLSLCVIGEDPFGASLDQLVQGESVGSRKIVVQRYPKAPEGRCDVAFFTKASPEALAALGPGVLTVGEGDTFLREGGIIAFVIENRRVRFDVSQSAARKASVRLSSRLLGVARTVER